MQLNVFYTLHEKMQSIDIGYFDLTLDIEDAFERKRGDIQSKVEALSIVHFKTTGGRPRHGSKYGNKLAIEGKKEPKRLTMGESSTDSPPPPYSPATSVASPALSAGDSDIKRANSTGGAWGAVAKAKPPPPKPKPSRLSGVPAAETCTALYDYEAQQEGDLSFSAGDVIEVIHRTSNDNEWWTGKFKGRQGQFPGKLYIVMWIQ
jgi:amphiphysin